MSNVQVVENAIVIPTISMVKAFGSQSPEEVLRSFWDIFNDRIPDDSHTVDVYGILTSGLYSNTPVVAPHAHRDKSLETIVRYYKYWRQTVEAEHLVDPFTVPNAYELFDWDAIMRGDLRVLSLMRQAMGILKNAAKNEGIYSEILKSTSAAFGKAATDAQIAFYNEEFAMLYLMASKQIPFKRTEMSMRRSNDGALFFTYNDAITHAEIKAFQILSKRLGKIPKGQAFYVDTSDPKKPIFLDYAELVDGLDFSANPNIFFKS